MPSIAGIADAPSFRAGRFEAPALEGSLMPRRVILGVRDYPRRLLLEMGVAAPTEVWIAGDPARLDAPQIAVIGSREISPALWRATRRLAETISGAGWAVTSGFARGADSAAFAGGAAGGSGTLALPASGLFQLRLGALRPTFRHATFLSAAPLRMPFNAGLALQRNQFVCALADAVFLTATGLRGGSWHVVRGALAAGKPVYCFECGMDTPPGNAWLLDHGLARPVRLGFSPPEFIAELKASIRSCDARFDIYQPAFFD